jgi:hypothetical protein
MRIIQLITLLALTLSATAQSFTFKLGWDQYPETNCTINIWYSTNSATNMVLYATNITTDVTSTMFTVPDVRRPVYVGITASNSFGLESEMSNIIATPTRPRSWYLRISRWF